MHWLPKEVWENTGANPNVRFNPVNNRPYLPRSHKYRRRRFSLFHSLPILPSIFAGMVNKNNNKGKGPAKRPLTPRASSTAKRSRSVSRGRKRVTTRASSSAMDVVSRSRSRAASRPRMAVSRGHSGQYQGSIKLNKKYQNRHRKAMENGVAVTSEISGTVTDLNCVYLLHTAADPSQMITYVAYALVRHLLEKVGGQKILSTTAKLQNLGYATATGLSIKVYAFGRYDVTATENPLIEFDSTATSTLASLGDTLAGYLVTYSGDYPLSGTDSEAKSFEWTKLSLYQKTAATGATQELVGQLDLRYTTVHINASSVLKFQNSTVSGDAATTTDSVSANPLQGYSYYFGKGYPQTANIQVKHLSMYQNQPNKGLTATTAAAIATSELYPSPAYENPPLPNQFRNCTKSAKVRLDPGMIQSSKVYYSVDMNVMNILKKIKYQPITVATKEYIPNIITPTAMVALEEMINIGESVSTNVRFECEKDLTVYCTSYNKKNPILPSHSSAAYTAF